MTERKDWENRQAKTFSKWCNMYLKKKGYGEPIKDVVNPQDFFGEGIIIAHLLNALYDVPLPKKKFKKNAKSDIQKLDNIDKALKLFQTAELEKICPNRRSILDKNFKQIMGMIWQIILDYNINGINSEEGTAKQGLLMWCRKKTKGYPGVDGKINNFTKDWANGNAFLALTDRHTTNMVTYDHTKDPSEKLDEAFTANEKLGVDRLLEVEDLTDSIPDEHSVMTYVSELFKLFSQEDTKERAAEHVSKFLKFQRRIMSLGTEYEQRVSDFKEWAEGKIKDFEDAEAPEDNISAGESLKEYKTYLIDEKPPRMADVVDIQDLYANIQGELKVNGRKPYVASDGNDPSSLVELCDKLMEAENTFSKQVRDTRLGFIEKMDLCTSATDEQRKEWSHSFDTFDADSSGFLDRVEFKAALSAIGISLNDDEFEALFSDLAIEDNKINRDSYTNYLEEFYSQSDDAESVLKSLDVLGGKEASTEEELQKLSGLSEDDIAFLVENMGEGEDIATFIANSFAE